MLKIVELRCKIRAVTKDVLILRRLRVTKLALINLFPNLLFKKI